MAKRRGPSSEAVREQMDHSYEHRGETGMFGSIFPSDVPEWSPVDGDNEVAIVSYLCKENSEFRKKNPDLNRPFTDKQLKDGDAWAYKLSVFVHGNLGPNKDRKVCMKTFKEACPVCELRDELREELSRLKDNNRTDKDLEDRISQLGASKRAVYNIISFNSKKDREKGVMVWVAPHASIEDVIIERARDRRSGEFKLFGVLDEGWNVLFTKKGKGLNTEYSGVDIEDRRKEDDLSEKEIDEVMDDAFNLDEQVEISTYDELYELLHGVKPSEDTERGKVDDRRSRRREEAPPEEETRGRGRSRDRQAERAGSSSLKEDGAAGEEEMPECFGIEFNEKNECQDCVSAIFKECMKKTKDKEAGGSGKESDRGKRGKSSREGRSGRSRK